MFDFTLNSQYILLKYGIDNLYIISLYSGHIVYFDFGENSENNNSGCNRGAKLVTNNWSISHIIVFFVVVKYLLSLLCVVRISSCVEVRFLYLLTVLEMLRNLLKFYQTYIIMCMYTEQKAVQNRTKS